MDYFLDMHQNLCCYIKLHFLSSVGFIFFSSTPFGAIYLSATFDEVLCFNFCDDIFFSSALGAIFLSSILGAIFLSSILGAIFFSDYKTVFCTGLGAIFLSSIMDYVFLLFSNLDAIFLSGLGDAAPPPAF